MLREGAHDGALVVLVEVGVARLQLLNVVVVGAVAAAAGDEGGARGGACEEREEFHFCQGGNV